MSQTSEESHQAEMLMSIPAFFANKCVLITGGSGFIGKVLVEKLLRSCPDLDTIFLLMRPKKGKSPEERIKTITDLPLFDRLKSERPTALSKLRLILGDVCSLGLGLSPTDRLLLTAATHIVFHGAASVRFDDPLTDAVLMNTRGTRELMALALDMQKLEVLVHISTTYCLVSADPRFADADDRKVIEERLYPVLGGADWREAIEAAERVERVELDVVTEKYIEPMPNTYTFAKALGEQVVYELGNGKIPQVVFRPSIVISSVKEPMPGWMDNFNGPVGLLVASGKGVVRTIYADPDIIADYIPVDLVVKALIISAWKQGTTSNPAEKFETAFYNGSNNGYRPVKMSQILEMGRGIAKEYPLEDMIWYPEGGITKCIYYHYFRLFFYQLIPALLIDGLLRLSGNKPILWKIQRKIFVANMALKHFILNQWQFINEKAAALENSLLPTDREAFAYNKDEVTELEFFTNATIGGKKYLLKEGDDYTKARAHAQRMWYLSWLWTVVWYLGLFWILFVKVDVLAVLYRKYEQWVLFLTTD